MMNNGYILAIDQGTSGSKTVLFDTQGHIVSKETEPLTSFYPKPGYVEQNPEQIYKSVLTSVRKCIKQFREQGGATGDIRACGISNQRETFLLWNYKGEPVTNAIVWQCKRSVDLCSRLKENGHEPQLYQRTGLFLDPYFSGTKLLWLIENNSNMVDEINTGKLYFGTIDTWLLFKLTNGKSYYTDHTNASRTLLFNIHELQWDPEILDMFACGKLHFPEVKPSTFSFGHTDFSGILDRSIPITGMIGDSHAAAFGEGCFSPGTAKATLGTGCSILLNTGKPVRSGQGIVATICWSTSQRTDYALEGVIVTCGATVKWLRDQLRLINSSEETEKIAADLADNNGVYLIPAFSGMGAPYWKMDARAAIFGLTFDSNDKHIVRAALESVAFQIKDVITAMTEKENIRLQELKIDGGMSANRFIMQLIADLLEIPVINIGLEEVSALGASYMAGLQAGIYSDLNQLETLLQEKKQYLPGEGTHIAKNSYKSWYEIVNNYLKTM
jgi:glycerol kinase